MRPYLLVDFGTTSTKAALADLDTGRFVHLRRYDALPNSARGPGECEISLRAIQRRFAELCDEYYQIAPFAGVVICSEMLGFALLDEDGAPLSEYISWQDERSLQVIDGQSTFALVQERAGALCRRLTSLAPRPGFPLVKLIHLARSQKLPDAVRVLSLPDWLAHCTDEPSRTIHPTMLAGMAFCKVHENTLASELVELVCELGGPHCRFNELAPAHAVAGYWHKDGRKIPLYTGVGDHQCAVLGACNVPRRTLSINLGTGSQVALIDGDAPGDEWEIRPYFDDRSLQTATQIPAGRALTSFIGLLEEIAATAGTPPDFWQRLAELDEAALQAADLDIDLSVFQSARTYRDGGRIGHIHEHSLNLHNFLASLLAGFIDQYIPVLAALDPQRRAERLILSGGIAQRMPRLHQLFASRSGYATWTATALDESFLGLRSLALVADGRAATALEAQDIFGRTCDIGDT